MESTTIVNQLNQSLATPMPELSAEQKNAISWTICCTNAFVMLTSGLVIDIKKVLENLTHKRGFKSGIIIGLIGQLVLMPCMTFLAISIGNLDNAISLAVIIQGCCPGSAVLNLFSAYNDGNAILAWYFYGTRADATVPQNLRFESDGPDRVRERRLSRDPVRAHLPHALHSAPWLVDWNNNTIFDHAVQ